MKKLFFGMLLLMGCSKNPQICGQVYAIPEPTIYPDTTLYYVAARINNGNFVWIELTRPEWDSVKVGDWVCEKTK